MFVGTANNFIANKSCFLSAYDFKDNFKYYANFRGGEGKDFFVYEIEYVYVSEPLM